MWKKLKQNQNYSINEDGIIKNDVTNKILKPFETYNGYLRVRINRKAYRVHRLVAENFIENTNNGTQINHKDGDKKNNKANNLEWCTPKENIRHAYETGLKRVSYKNIKKPEKVCQLSMDGKLLKVYNSFSEMERETGFDNSNVSKVCKGKQKTAYGYKWQYASL